MQVIPLPPPKLNPGNNFARIVNREFYVRVTVYRYNFLYNKTK